MTSWLTSKVSDDLITIPDYNNIRKGRPNDQRGGGICTYLKRSIRFLYLHEFDDPSFETQWFLLKPNRLPRGINSIIMVTIYQPPGNDDYALRNHIFQFLDRALIDTQIQELYFSVTLINLILVVSAPPLN